MPSRPSSVELKEEHVFVCMLSVDELYHYTFTPFMVTPFRHFGKSYNMSRRDSHTSRTLPLTCTQYVILTPPLPAPGPPGRLYSCQVIATRNAGTHTNNT
jgi:hypothetical protein